MVTSNVICLDTNVLSALFTSEAGSDTLAADLFTRSQTHQLVIHAVVRAELLAHPQMSPALLTKGSVRLSFRGTGGGQAA